MTTTIDPSDVMEIPRQFRLQWEDAQQRYVLLYPEGMVELSMSAGEILKRVDGAVSIADIVRSLEQAFPGAALRQDVLEFLGVAHERNWIRKRQAG